MVSILSIQIIHYMHPTRFPKNDGYMDGTYIEQRDRFIGQFIGKESKVLDLGCGDGRFLHYLKIIGIATLLA